MHAGLTILTTADADAAIMELFADTLAGSGLGNEGRVTWLVVDGLLAHPAPPCFPDSAAFFELKWITPSTPLPQLNAVMHGLSLIQGPVVIMDPDMPGNIADISRFLAAHRQGAEIVFGRRIQRQGTSPLRQRLTALYNLTARYLLGLPVHDLNTPMISITGQVIDRIGATPPGCPSPRFHVFQQLANALDEVPIHVAELAKQSSYSPMARTALGLVRLGEILRFIAWKRRTKA